jgi:hypothetical protein
MSNNQKNACFKRIFLVGDSVAMNLLCLAASK